MQVIYRYFAIKPIKAEHPVGSGEIVDYKPGEEIPAGEWGRAADNLVELGKAARVAFNVPEEGEDVASVELEMPAVVGTKHVAAEKKGPGRPRKRQP